MERPDSRAHFPPTAREDREPAFTIVAVPKAFNEHVGVVQKHAVRSWLAQRPAPEIVLCGDDPGTAETCAEYGLKHAPHIEYNDLGTPLMRSVLAQGEEHASTNTILYTNADIVFGGELARAVDQLSSTTRPFVATGIRWNVPALEDIDYTDSEAVADLTSRVRRTGHLKRPWATDYFLFRKGFYAGMPPLTVGRKYTDNWMIWYALSVKAEVIDLTPRVTAIHEIHHHAHVIIGDPAIRYSGKGAPGGVEASRNLRLAGGRNHVCNVLDATIVLTPDGMERRISASRYARKWLYARVLQHYRRRLVLWLSHHQDRLMIYSHSSRRKLGLYRW